MGFSRQEYWSGLPRTPPGHLPNRGIKPASLPCPALTAGFFTTNTTWEAPRSCNRPYGKLTKEHTVSHCIQNVYGINVFISTKASLGWQYKSSWTTQTLSTFTKHKPLGGVRLTPFLRHHCTGKIPKESAWHNIESLLGSGLRSSIVTWKKWLLKTWKKRQQCQG